MGWRLAGTSYGGAAGPPGPPGPAGAGIPLSVTLTNDQGGNVAVCQPVYASSAGKYKLARANALAAATAIGLASTPLVANGDPGVVQTGGILTAATGQWDAQTGDFGGLVAGKQYWLSNTTAGKLIQDVAPNAAGSFDTLIGVALNTTDMDLTIAPPIGPL